ncbi:AI-2E family transporter [Propionimicrobium sp. PCR01-08-3]|uniref:AI-2E family transporter n=1 Tax=Propionimicrobium sp. PCR01-08-3 TaxID=3052086 RepID=UPI00255C81C1|nr:AI-2E family transporter [Propionimicrobium sp. PCR01-08-3]WIY83497.1 AI-2E family transporter [Propionimicrobium sp. PCR01-08-3]
MAEQSSSTTDMPGRPRFNTIVIGVAGALICLLCLRQFSGIIGPWFLAINLMITAYPLHTWLVRKGTPSWLSAMVVSLTVFAVLIALVAGLVWSVSEMVGILPQYAAEFTVLYNRVTDWAEVQFDIGEGGWGQLLNTLDPTRFIGAATSLLSGASGLASAMVGMIGIIVAAIVFMAMDTPGLERRLRFLAGNRSRVATAMSSFAHGVRRYWIVTTVFGIIVAVFDGVVLAIMGVPLAIVWGIFSFLTNYIPNIGFVIGLIPPAVVALFANGWQSAVIVIVMYCVLNFVIQTIIQPRFAGESVGVTPTVSFMSLLLWASVMGGMGTLLALPMTLLVKSLLIDADPRARWFNALIASDPKDAEPLEDDLLPEDDE